MAGERDGRSLRPFPETARPWASCAQGFSQAPGWDEDLQLGLQGDQGWPGGEGQQGQPQRKTIAPQPLHQLLG